MKYWASLVTQCERICLPMQETQVWSLIWEDPICCKYWSPCSTAREATALRSLRTAAREQTLLATARAKPMQHQSQHSRKYINKIIKNNKNEVLIHASTCINLDNNCNKFLKTLIKHYILCHSIDIKCWESEKSLEVKWKIIISARRRSGWKVPANEYKVSLRDGEKVLS